MADKKRLIDAVRLVIKLSKKVRFGRIEYDDLLAVIADAPTVDAAEVVHGRWEQVQRWATKAKYRCSVCGREIMSAVKVNIEKYPYCHCGAKMDGGNEDE